ncbi:MAG: beta-ketoacyl-ACP synthase III [Acidobacteriota bacterium]|nr:ketoacyl-ACP synthase III [Blastocatellia bacterium]MDW8412967.1 beta-ketoacyl-ACP synthase III [Acidobacteriota bacterium]
MLRAAIVGTGHALPQRVLTNTDLEQMVDTSDEWITTRTGIKQRRIAAEDEYTSVFAVEAARRALEAASVQPQELDLVICATVCPDMTLPSTACLIQAKLKAKRAAAFDLVAACSGFVYALSVADQFIRTQQAKRILIIGAEVLSRYVDYTDRATCIIFGDGAGAAVIADRDDGSGVILSRIQSDGDYADFLYTPGGGTRYPTSYKSIDERLHYIKMRGNELFKVAVKNMCDITQRVLDESKLTAADIDLFIPHQANQRITDAVADRLGLPQDKVYANIDRIGNTSSASIPIALDECVHNGRVKKGDLIVLTSFGAGATWGSAVLRW